VLVWLQALPTGDGRRIFGVATDVQFGGSSRFAALTLSLGEILADVSRFVIGTSALYSYWANTGCGLFAKYFADGVLIALP